MQSDRNPAIKRRVAKDKNVTQTIMGQGDTLMTIPFKTTRLSTPAEQHKNQTRSTTAPGQRKRGGESYCRHNKGDRVYCLLRIVLRFAIIPAVIWISL